MSKKLIPTALTIAGVDSGGGAGIAADLKTFAAIGVHGLVAVTSVTAQNTYAVIGIHDIPPQMVELQIRAVADDIGVDAAKTGMLSNPEIVRTVARVVKEYNFPLVVDPVIFAKSGARLLLEEAVEVLIKELLPVALITTPNISEAERLSGMIIRNLDDAEKAAKKISDLYGVRGVIVKGGHLTGSEKSIDILYYEGVVKKYKTPRIDGCTHGTGCSFSAAITGYLAKGFNVFDAVAKAKEFIYNAILRSYKIGKGHCPVNPSANVDLYAEIYKAQRELEDAVKKLLTRDEEFVHLIPEVQTNFVYSPPVYLAKNIEDVVGIPGRIVNYVGRARASGYPMPGASSHMARAVLTIMKYDPSIRSGINIAYSKEIEDTLRELGFKVSYFDRREEPEEVKKLEGGTTRWGISVAVERIKDIPDAVIDYGEHGKEPLIMIFGKDPSEVVNKVFRILDKAKEKKIF
ncbi:MAG: bifunctional hydroxymethylpyrimidine kinase/phosphomethylpyrimidine kinase [Sulfolobales archaeon]